MCIHSLLWKVVSVKFREFFYLFRQEDLFQILKAYTIHNPADGYCQAQAPIAAILLMHMPAEQAFWCLVAICEKYLPGYYAPGLVSTKLFSFFILFGSCVGVSFYFILHCLLHCYLICALIVCFFNHRKPSR